MTRDNVRAMFIRSPMIDPTFGEALIEAAATPRFAAILLGAARSLDRVDEVFAYQLDGQGDVRVLATSGERSGINERTGAYVRRFYNLDPVATHRTGGRGGFIKRIRAGDIPAGEYRDLCFDRPGFRDKVCFGWRHASSLLVLSFYRGPDSEGAHLEKLTALGEIAMAALSYRARQSQREAEPPLSLQPLELLLERLARMYPNLTPRESQIVARTLLGSSAAAIADELGIRPATVLTYRLRAYGRYGFRQSSDFLGALLH